MVLIYPVFCWNRFWAIVFKNPFSTFFPFSVHQFRFHKKIRFHDNYVHFFFCNFHFFVFWKRIFFLKTEFTFIENGIFVKTEFWFFSVLDDFSVFIFAENGKNSVNLHENGIKTALKSAIAQNRFQQNTGLKKTSIDAHWNVLFRICAHCMYRW